MTHGTGIWEQPRVNVAFLRSVFKRPEWWNQAACAGKGQAPWFTEPYSDAKTNPLSSHSVRKAKTICSTCPVRRECLTAGLNETTGIWGGALVDERRSGDVELILFKMDQQAIEHGLRGAA